MTWDYYLTKRYHKKEYNCFHFVEEIYRKRLGVHLASLLPRFADNQPQYSLHQHRGAFRRLRSPRQWCLCVFKPYNPRQETSHVGIWCNGEILHLDEAGPRFSPLNMMLLAFRGVRYYELRR